jgi:pyridoxamine 5'-phosphate oxidase
MDAARMFDLGQMPDQAWRRLEHGANDRADPMHLVTLATVSVDWRPAARIMVLRGADRGSGRVWFHTDRRSPKVTDIRANACVCAVGYDARDGVELRLSARASLHDYDTLADRQWEQIALAARAAYATTAGPGEPLALPDPRVPWGTEAVASALTARARANFMVIELAVETIDWFQVVGMRQQRAVMHAASRWVPTALAP